MFCGNCGNEIDDNGSFCANCGINLKETNVPNVIKLNDPPNSIRNNNSMWKVIAIVSSCIVLVIGAGLLSYLTLAKDGTEKDVSDNEDKKSQIVTNMQEDDKLKKESEEKALMEENEKLHQELDKKELLEENTMLKERINELNKKVQNKSYSTSSSYFGDSYYIEWEDLDGLSKWEVELLRNEIYARHGYVFKEKRFKDYFSAMNWYAPNSNFHEGMFNSIEKRNISTMVEYEKYHGWR